MGKKNRELKQRLQANPIRSLIIVDDVKIRKQIFAKTAVVIRKIDKLRQEQEIFYSKDQQLFNDWYNLNFRKEIGYYDQKNREYINLANFHNEMVALSQINKITSIQAYAILINEKKKYLTGTDIERKEIDKVRIEREEYARKKIQAENATFNPFSGDYEDDYDDQYDDQYDEENNDNGLNDIEQKLRATKVSDLNTQDRKIYNLIKSLTTEQLSLYLESSNGYNLLREAIEIISIAEDTDLLLKAWDAAPKKNKVKYAKEFNRKEGISFEELVDNLRIFKELKDEQHIHSKGKTNSSEETEDGHYISLGNKEKGHSDQEMFLIKQIYRKLVRRIHPDVQDLSVKEANKKWNMDIWQKVQQAYKEKNLRILKRLELITLIRLNDLQSLTLDEIANCNSVFEKEFQNVQSEIKAIKSNLAWKFSTKQNYDSLIVKIRREFQREVQPLLEEINRIIALHSYYDEIISSPQWERKFNKKPKLNKQNKGLKKYRGFEKQSEF